MTRRGVDGDIVDEDVAPWPSLCMRPGHRHKDALRYGLCAACMGGLTESEALAEAAELAAELEAANR